MKPASEGPVTVLVFKDNLVARTFQISMGWITRLGVLLSVITAIALLTSLFAVKYYRAARYADPVRVRELEQELADLRVSYQAALDTQKASTPAAEATPVATLAPAAPVAESAAPVPTVTVTVTATPAPVAQGAPVPVGAGALFTGLPSETQTFAGQAPIAVRAARLAWVGSGNNRSLRLRFNIQYILERGSQQGRIVLLARGPETLIAHPVGIFRKAGDSTLIAPDRGEYFSVSRMREVKAEFGPVSSTGALQEVEVLLFNAQGQLLIRERLVPDQASPAPSRPKPAAPAQTPAEGSEPAQNPASETDDADAADGGAE